MARPVTVIGKDVEPPVALARRPWVQWQSRASRARSCSSVTSLATPAHATSTLQPVSADVSMPSTSKAIGDPPASPSSSAVAPVRKTIV